MPSHEIAAVLLLTALATGAAIGSPGTPGVGIVILATECGLQRDTCRQHEK